MRRPDEDEGDAKDTTDTDYTAAADGLPDGAERSDPDPGSDPGPGSADPTATAAYRWLRVAKLLLGLAVSLLTALKLLGLLP